jgi:hypothetical protein
MPTVSDECDSEIGLSWYGWGNALVANVTFTVEVSGGRSCVPPARFTVVGQSFGFVFDPVIVIGVTGTVVVVVEVVGAVVVEEDVVEVEVVGAVVVDEDVVEVDVEVVGAVVVEEEVVDVDDVVDVPPPIVVVVVEDPTGSVVDVVDVDVEDVDGVVEDDVLVDSVEVVVVGGGASPANRTGTATWSFIPAVVPNAIAQTIPAACCAAVGGHGNFGASTSPLFPALSIWFETGGPVGPCTILNVPDDVPSGFVSFSCTGVQPTGMLLPWKRIVGAVGSPLHSMIELSTLGVTPDADQLIT